ncbi:MAG TPA: hypothetical protein VEP90_04025, partial [Methylomirabilota bacterium]|nr:hypothetical protein [Methylomirabilota bacterium]
DGPGKTTLRFGSKEALEVMAKMDAKPDKEPPIKDSQVQAASEQSLKYSDLPGTKGWTFEPKETRAVDERPDIKGATDADTEAKEKKEPETEWEMRGGDFGARAREGRGVFHVPADALPLMEDKNKPATFDKRFGFPDATPHMEDKDKPATFDERFGMIAPREELLEGSGKGGRGGGPGYGVPGMPYMKATLDWFRSKGVKDEPEALQKIASNQTWREFFGMKPGGNPDEVTLERLREYGWGQHEPPGLPEQAGPEYDYSYGDVRRYGAGRNQILAPPSGRKIEEDLRSAEDIEKDQKVEDLTKDDEEEKVKQDKQKDEDKPSSKNVEKEKPPRHDPEAESKGANDDGYGSQHRNSGDYTGTTDHDPDLDS